MESDSYYISVGRKSNGSNFLGKLFAILLFLLPPFVGAVLLDIGASATQNSISRRWKLPAINSSVSLDPVSLITLFFDAAEKALIERSGDLTVTACAGLFVNPTTAWSEYGTLYPGEGVRYYNPKRTLTSTVEIAQVHKFVTRLAVGRKNVGFIVNLYPRKRVLALSFSWLVIRPFTLLAILFVAAASRDFIALSAIGALIVGQTIVILNTIRDGTTKTIENNASLEKNVFFLANNVTVIVESYGRLFVQACSSQEYKKAEKPVLLEVLSTLVFMTGVLLLGIAGLNSKIAYLVGHALQAIMLSFHSNDVLGTRTLNRITWEVGKPVDRLIRRRREAYLWATEETTGNTDWLRWWHLADVETLAYLEQTLAKPQGIPPIPID
jgi:hypothetical protein